MPSRAGFKFATKDGKFPSKAPLGSGQRFKALEGKLEKKGAKDPGALAAWIGRKKFGDRKFNNLSQKGKKK